MSKGSTQEALAQTLNYSKGWLSNVETGQLRPLRNTVIEFEAALGVLATVQIVPAAANPHHLGAFTIATVDGTDVAYVQSAVQGIVTADKKDLVRLNDVWESVRSQALPVGMSADLIRRTVEERWT
jgi:transcriptional regulator with XRE-family HTH domain